MSKHYGDITITVNNTYFSDITEVLGALTIKNGATCRMDNLKSIESLMIEEGGCLIASALTHITEYMGINGKQSSLNADLLSEVKCVDISGGAKWKVQSNASISGYLLLIEGSHIEANNVSTIYGDVYIKQGSTTTLPNLKYISGNVSLSTPVNLAKLEKVGGELCIGAGSIVTLPMLKQVCDDLVLEDSGELEANNLLSIGNDLVIHNSSKLTAKNLTVVQGEVDKSYGAVLNAPLIGVDSTNTDNLSGVLTDRGGRYGEFKDNAAISQSLKETMAKSVNWPSLEPYQKEALEMIAHKISRILNGDITYVDSWTDICGYAKLVENRLSDK